MAQKVSVVVYKWVGSSAPKPEVTVPENPDVQHLPAAYNAFYIPCPDCTFHTSMQGMEHSVLCFHALI